MPLARYYLYSQGVDIWAAPTLAASDGWIAAMRHIALEGRCYVIGVNPCLHVDQIPVDFPHRDRLWANDHDNEGWVEPGNSVIIHPTGKVLAGPARHEETILYADVELAACVPPAGSSTQSPTTAARTSSNSGWIPAPDLRSS